MAKKVLLVDDERDARFVFAESLRYHGFEVISAEDGMKAMEKIEKELPDIVLLDMVMPGLSGWEVIQMIKSDPRLRDIPVIALSAAAGVTDEGRALRLGAVDFIAKPCEAKDLVDRINRVFERRRGF